jgi:tRNA threonylcarbamoyladenosine biosynthesis protein TsaB
MAPTLLAIDTATGPCSVAVWKDGRVAAYVENVKPTQQSASLMPMVEQALAEAGITYAALSGVACTTGPGSFTGIRVGLASASGISFAAGIAGMGFTTLEVLAFGAAAKGGDTSTILAVLNAGKGEFYFQAFSALPFAALGETQLGTLEQAASLAQGGLQCGNAPLLPGFTDALVPFPAADAMAGLAATRAGGALRPFYIRDADAKLPTKALR